MFLLTTISNTSVEGAFMAFGEVHSVFPGTYKDDFKDVWNGNRHVRFTPSLSSQFND